MTPASTGDYSHDAVLKYVSDVSKAKYKEYSSVTTATRERAQRAMRRERFQVPKSSFDYLFEHRNEPIGEH
ncbi:MAG: hypothetical protein ACLR3T_00125 [Alistipes finegoldii]